MPGPSPLGLGLVGCGRFGSFLLDVAQDLPGLRAVAVTDHDPQAASALAHRLDLAPAPSVEALLAHHNVDLVAIASPPASHATLTVQALDAGCHVFCEKPMALTLTEAGAVAAAVTRSGRRLAVDHVLRHNPLLALLDRLRMLEADGAPLLGPLRRFAVENDASDEHLPAGHWFWDAAVSGGILLEHGVHFFDACRHLMGADPQQLQALATSYSRPGVIDTVLASAVYPHGRTATFLHAFTHADRAEHQLTRLDWGFAEARLLGWIPVDLAVEVWCGEDGRTQLIELPSRAEPMLAVPGYRLSGVERITVEKVGTAADPVARSRSGDRDAPDRLRLTASLGGESAKPYAYAESVRAAFTDLLDAIRSGRAPAVGVREGWASVATALAGQQAADTGTVVTPVPVPEGL